MPRVASSTMRRFACLAVLVLAACGSTPPASQPGDPGPSAASATLAYQRRLEEGAALQERQGRLADAAVSLELLALLRPDDGAVATRLAALRTRIDTTNAARLQRGAEAFRRGQLDAATSHYLAVLAWQPDNDAAADALRAIEKERDRRLLAARQRAKKPPVAPGSGD